MLAVVLADATVMEHLFDPIIVVSTEKEWQY